MTKLEIEKIEHLDYQPHTLKSGVVFWVRKHGCASGDNPIELEACVYPPPERGFWYRFYERLDDEIPRIEIWHYGDVSPVKYISSASREFPEFQNLNRITLCALAGVMASEQIDVKSLKMLNQEDRETLVRRANRWAEKIDWL